MKTRRRLIQLVPDIIQHMHRWQSNMEFNFRLYKILEGQVKSEVEKSLEREIMSKSALHRAIQRIPPINIIKRTTDKLSKLYVESPRRKAGDSESDKELIEEFSKETCINVAMDTANRFYNGLHSFALEPFIEEGKHQVRVLAPHQFFVYSDSVTNPSKHTVFCKLIGRRLKNRDNPAATKDGRRDDQEKRPELVDIIALYSDDEFLIIDSDGSARTDIMKEMNVTSTKNPFGRIPFVYGKKTQVELMPFPNQAGLDYSILIPKLYTDLNYAAQFCSHSVTWIRNMSEGGIKEFNPDAILDLGQGDEDGQPEIGTIKPEVDIPEQLSLIDKQFQEHLNDIGIKASTTGQLSNGRDASAIGKAIDEGDISAEKKNQMSYFKKIEHELWSLMASMQNVWVRRRGLQVRQKFSPNFTDEFNIEYSEVKPMKSFSQKIQEVKDLQGIKLISRRQSIATLYPEWTDTEVEQWIAEVDKENEEMMEKAIMAMGDSAGTAQENAGQFKEGNQAGANQDLESRELEDRN